MQHVILLRRPHQAEDAGLGDVLPLASGNVAEGKRAQRCPNRHQADDHAEIADAIDDERLVGGGRGALPLDVKPDQEIRANADQFPEDEHHHDVARDDDAQHAEAKQRQILEEPMEAALAMQMWPSESVTS